ncbi:MAG: PAS domain S-box protein [Bacteroidetes bacterium]|jgi:PAS domain S-box-containing protein|nr:PAS domain S-box protein [Bacteroidota bacterium]
MKMNPTYWKKFFDHLQHIVFVVNQEDDVIYCNLSKKELSFINPLNDEPFSIASRLQKADDSLSRYFSHLIPANCQLLQYKLAEDDTVKDNHILLLKTDISFDDAENLYLLEEWRPRHLNISDSVSLIEKEAILKAIPDLLFVLDSRYHVLDYYSASTEDLLKSPKDFLGKHMHEFLTNDVMKVIVSALEEAKEKGLSSGKVYAMEHKNEQQWYELSVSYESNIPLPIFVVLVRNITTAQRTEQHLRESEARFRAVVEQSDEGIIMFDEAGRITLWNKGEENMTGYAAEEVMGKYIWDVMHMIGPDSIRKASPSGAQTIRKRILNLLARKDQRWVHERNEREIQTKNGEIRTLQTLLFPVELAGNYMFGSINRDITQQKESERELKETTARLKAVIRAMPDYMLVIDNKGQLVDIFEQQPLRFLNELPEKGWTLKQLFTESNKSLLAKAIQRTIGTKQIQLIDLQIPFKGEQLAYEARISPMNSNSVLMMLRETTNIRQLENNLLQNNNLLQTLTHLATRFINLPLARIDETIDDALAKIGSFAGVDRVYIFDYNWDEQIMTNTYEWCSEGTSPEIENLKRVPNKSIPEWVASHQQGEITIVEDINQLDTNDPLYQILEPQGIKSLITIPLMEQDRCLGYVGFDAVKKHKSFVDSELSLLQIFAELLTNLKLKKQTDYLLKQNQHKLEYQNQELSKLNDKLKIQNEEILKKNAELDRERDKAEASDKLKTAFLNNISHEIRTPLNGIVGFSQLLFDTDISMEDRNDYIDALGTSVDRLTDTFNDIMDVSLLMSGNMPFNIETIHLQSLLEEVYKKHQLLASAKELDLKLEIPKQHRQLHFDSDRGYLFKIANELLSNAIKYTNKGFVEIGFQIEENELILYVHDSGKGIGEAALPDIYKPFIQEDFSSTRDRRVPDWV